MSGEQEEEGLFPFDTDLLVKAFFVVVLLWGIYLALQIPTFDREADKVYPRLLVAGLLLLTAVQLAKMQFPGIVDRLVPEEASTDETQQLREELQETGGESRGRSRRERHKYEINISLWVTVLPVLMFVFGFAYVLPPFVFALTYYMERSVPKALLTTGLFIAFGYVIFLELLNVPLWQGMLFGGTVG